MRKNIKILAIAGCFSLLASACASQKIDPELEKIEIPKKVEKVSEAKVIKEDKSKSLPNEFTCLVDKDKRIISLHKDEKRCEVFYTKFGQKDQVAWGENTQSVCDEVFNEIRSNIENKGFKCTDSIKIDEKKQETAAL